MLKVCLLHDSSLYKLNATKQTRKQKDINDKLKPHISSGNESDDFSLDVIIGIEKICLSIFTKHCLGINLKNDKIPKNEVIQ